MKDLGKTNHLLGWHSIKRKYISGIIVAIIGIFILIVGSIVLYYLFPDHIVYHYNVIIYNGPFFRLCLEIIVVSVGGLLLLIGLTLFIINTIKKQKY